MDMSLPPQPPSAGDITLLSGLTPWTLWAKWSAASQRPNSYHPLLCHLIDVAQCAEAMWRQVLPLAWKRRLAESLGVPEEDAERWVVFWAGLHDLGKACPGFQLQLQEPAIQQLLIARLQSSGLPTAPAPWIGHGDVSAQALRHILVDHFHMTGPSALEIALAVGGHHGRFPAPADLMRLPSASVGQRPWDEARLRYTGWLAQALGAPTTPPVSVPHEAGMKIAGFVSVVDWIGSSEIFFQHAAPDARVVPQLDISDYVALSRQRADEAFTTLGWTGWTPSTTSLSFPELFAGKKPRPLQQTTIELAGQLTTTAIVVIEAPMGEGKTEAAMYLADDWTTRFGQQGVYFALPSQASSDQMFERVAGFLSRRYPHDTVNTQLLHGHAALSATLRELRERGRALLTPTHVYTAQDDVAALTDSRDAHAGDGAVIAAEWFASAKRSLLAPFGVGTVDQALLAALQTLHVFVRLYGLSTKTVIVDEVHAYDTYMLTLLRRLMNWLGALRVPVILLSATLPSHRRHALIAAYAHGAGWPGWSDTEHAPEDQPSEQTLPATITHEPYPRVTWATPDGLGVRHIAANAERRQQVASEWLSALPTSALEPFPLAERLSELLAQGGCAAIICNTVARAQQVYRALKPFFPGLASDGHPQLELLHARFPLEERSARERRALQRFGLDGPRPDRAILVATQVIEQSLDLDFDLMVTDLAPGDLVLQRLGRLHRHDRHDRPRPLLLREPRLIIQSAPTDGDGAPALDPGSLRVYDPHILLRSWLALKAYPILTLPDDIEPLVERIYEERPGYPGAECPADANPALRAYWEQTYAAQQQALQEDEQQARHRYIGPPWQHDVLSAVAPFLRDEDAPELHPAFQALTRLTEQNVTVVCLGGTAEDPLLRPRGSAVNLRAQPTLDAAEQFLKRSVTLTDRRVVFLLLERDTPAAWRKSALLRRLRPLYFGADGVTTVGRWRLRLDPDEGLRVESPDDDVEM